MLFQPPANKVLEQPRTIAQLNDLVCQYDWTGIIPSWSQYTEYVSTDLSRFVGLAISGGLFGTPFASSDMIVDNLYPDKWGGVTNPLLARTREDSCLTTTGIDLGRP